MLIGIDASRANMKARTGTEWYSFHLIQELKKIDRENEYILYSKERLFDSLDRLPEKWESRVLLWPPKKFWTQFRLSFEMIVHSPDVLFIPAHIIPLVHPRKTVTTCHDIGFIKFPELYSDQELRYHSWSMDRAIRHAARIITVSEFTKREIINHYRVDENSVDVVHNAYDASLYKIIQDKGFIQSVIEKHSIRQPYFFYIGRLELKKNTPFLIESFVRFSRSHQSKYQLVLAGNPGNGYDQVEKTIRECDPENRIIKKIGYVQEEDVPCLMNGAMGFIFPSLYEGFGIPVLEAMACGIPVICSRIASLPEIALHSALYFDPKKSDSLISCLHDLVSHPGLKEDLIQKGRERVKMFSWKKCAEDTLRVLYKAYRD